MPTQTRSATGHPISILGDAFGSAAESLGQAVANASESARRAAQTTRRALGTGFYKACYGLSFGVVYSAVFVAELVPENSAVARAFREGGEAAREARRRPRTAHAKVTSTFIPAPARADEPIALAVSHQSGNAASARKAAKPARKPASAARQTRRESAKGA